MGEYEETIFDVKAWKKTYSVKMSIQKPHVVTIGSIHITPK